MATVFGDKYNLRKCNNRGSKNAFINWLFRQNVEQLAKKIECNRQLIYFWRSGQCKPSTKYAEKILKVAHHSLSLSDLTA